MPLTAGAALFHRAADLGREVIWLQINVLNVLGLLVKLEPEQAEVLAAIEDGPLVATSQIA